MRRRLLINNGDGTTSESVAYSGTITFEERPAETSITFECPGCTNFAIAKKGAYDLSTGQAFFASIVVMGAQVYVANSNQTGLNISMAVNYTINANPVSINYPRVTVTENGIEFSVDSITDTLRWFQAGEYEWIAW